MVLIISHQSALEYWIDGTLRRYPFADISGVPRISLPPGYKTSFHVADAPFVLEPARLSGTIHLLSIDEASRPKYGPYIWHIMPKNIPLKSFIKINESLYVASPELTFLQAASFCSLPQLLLIGNIMCGSFVYDDEAEPGQRKRDSITSVKKIKKYVRDIKSIKGIRLAEQAAQYILDNAASPMEAKLAVMLVLPIRLGGYGFPKPVLNKLVNLNDKAADFLGQQVCYIDVAWANKTGLEYDSTFWHLTPEKFMNDKKRSMALQQCGYKVFQLTAAQFRNFRAVEEMMDVLRTQFYTRGKRELLNRYFEQRYKIVNSILIFKPSKLSS